MQLLPFGLVALFAQVSAAFQPGQEHTGAYVAASAVLSVVVAVVVLVAWDRMPVWSWVLGPVLMALWMGLLLASQRTVETGLTPLVLLPIVWVALYHRPREAAVVVIAVVGALELDSVIKHDPASVIERRAVLWEMLGAVVVASAYALRRRLVGAIAEREEALRQAELLGAATRELNASRDRDEVVAIAAVWPPRSRPRWGQRRGVEAFTASRVNASGLARISTRVASATARVGRSHEHPLLLEAVRTGKPTRGPLVLDQLGPTVRETVRVDGRTHGAGVPIVNGGDLDGVLALATGGGNLGGGSRDARTWDKSLSWRWATRSRTAKRSAPVTDPLTGLANRRGLVQLVRERRGRRSFAVLAIDVDKLKDVNDRNGHAVGDELLRIVAEAIGRALREADVLARIGGDEFVAITFDADQASAGASAIAQRILESVRAAHTEKLHPHISIAVAHASQTDSATLVLRRADAALYDAKRLGGARYTTADAEAPLPRPGLNVGP